MHHLSAYNFRGPAAVNKLDPQTGTVLVEIGGNDAKSCGGAVDADRGFSDYDIKSAPVVQLLNVVSAQSVQLELLFFVFIRRLFRILLNTRRNCVVLPSPEYLVPLYPSLSKTSSHGAVIP
jgi:hypothetical protein